MTRKKFLISSGEVRRGEKKDHWSIMGMLSITEAPVLGPFLRLHLKYSNTMVITMV